MHHQSCSLLQAPLFGLVKHKFHISIPYPLSSISIPNVRALKLFLLFIYPVPVCRSCFQILHLLSLAGGQDVRTSQRVMSSLFFTLHGKEQKQNQWGRNRDRVKHPVANVRSIRGSRSTQWTVVWGELLCKLWSWDFYRRWPLLCWQR